MAELLFDEINNYTILVAPERSKRPIDEFNSKNELYISCPFCPGNEVMTPPDNLIIRGSSQDWTIRIFPNKYPAFVQNQAEIQLAGVQEVVVETEKHQQKYDQFSKDQIKSILEAYKSRIEVLKAKKNVKYVVIFKNHGEKAGATLEHPHSQIVGLFSVPAKVKEKNNNLEEFFLSHKKCFYCHLRNVSNLVCENQSYFCVMPNEARFPHECLIIPKNHEPYFEHTNNENFFDLAEIILKLIKSINSLLGFPSFNLILNNGVYLNSFNELSFHWHFQFIPRTSYLAGFEWATGMYIRQVDHEKAAEQLKKLIQKNQEEI